VPSESAVVRSTPEVAAALRDGRPVVALESSVLAQGLPIPANREAARLMAGAVRDNGATPAISAVVRGTATLGLEPDELDRFLRRDGVRKVSARDLPTVIVDRADGATTVAASLAVARLVSLPVFATGGIGGVHREPAYDESADLAELARTPMVVVCAGAKSILDLPATMERLETLGVLVVGYRTSDLPGFFTVSTGITLSARADTPAGVAELFRAQLALRRPGALLVVQPPPAAVALPQQVVDDAVTRALALARDEQMRGAAVTPYLLAEVERATGGRSLATNLALLAANAALAARVAVELSRAAPPSHAVYS
jgi:pseudouridine-5'-phosphate glycosidase